jgi:hypothetical protein
MCLLALGCSHSSLIYGKSWPDYLAIKLGLPLVRATTPGGSNSSYIEKLHYSLKTKKPSLVTIQLTSPYRSSIGFKPSEPSEINYNLNDSESFLNIGWYNWKIVDRKYANSKKLSDKHSHIVPKEMYNFWVENVVLSKWSLVKTMQEVFTIQSLCSFFETPCIFFSWFYNIDDMVTDEYQWIKKHISYIPGNALDFFSERNIPSITGNAHWEEKGHKVLVEDWIYPGLQSKIDLDKLLIPTTLV